MRVRALLAAVGVAASLAGPAAGAGWNAAGGGVSTSRAQSVAGGGLPSASVVGASVSLTWPQTELTGGAAVGGYVVRRFDAVTGVEADVGAGCAGLVPGAGCTEAAVPPGSWRYSVTPVVGAWEGAESPRSAAAIVAAPALLLAAPTTLTTLPGSLTGSLSGFGPGETLTFRLDDAAGGQIVAGTPASAGPDGAAAVGVAVPAGVANGAHTLYAVGGDGSVAAASFTVAADVLPPVVSAAAAAKAQGGIVAFVRQGGSYYVYANASDPGSPASGVATVTADVSSLGGEAAVPLAAGSYAAGGVSYGFRSAALTVPTPLAPAAYTFAVTATDAAGNSATAEGFSLVVDNTAPVATDVQTTNTQGGQTGRPDPGDTIRFTYAKELDPVSLLAGWDGASVAVTVRFLDGGAGNDLLEVWNGANAAQLPLGQVNLGRPDFVSANASFTASSMAQSGGLLTVTLGTLNGSVTRAGGNGTMVWSPSSAVFDRAGNTGTTATVTESGSADRDF